MKLGCYLESLLGIHRPDCERCHPHENWGPEVRKRLEELNLGTEPHSTDNGDPEEVEGVLDPKPNEGIASPISLAQQKKIV